MRVTQNYSIQNLLREVNDTREHIAKLRKNIATGKRINQISDDPEKIEKVLQLKKTLKLNGQFESNLNNALDFMNMTSQSLDDAANLLMQTKDLAIQGADGLQAETWNAFAEQVDQYLKELVDISNTKFNNRYLFGGSNTHQQPFSLAPDGSMVSSIPDNIEGALKTEIGEHKVYQYNVNGKEAFLDSTDVFQSLIDLRDAFRSQDAQAVQALIDDLDGSINQVVQQNANLGAKINRFEMFLQQYENQDVKLEEMLSRTEDTDIAKAITELQMHETGLQSALQVLARTMNISLMNYMK